MDFVGRELALLTKDLRARFEAALAEAGGTMPTWVVLSRVMAEEGLSQRQLAGRIGVEGPTLTRHLDRLEAEGLIVRRRDPVDRRILRVEPTAEARRLHTELARVAAKVDAELLAGLSEAEVARLRRLLARLRANVRGTDVASAATR